VLDPLKVVITNLPQSEVACRGANHPQRPELGERELVLTEEIWIERADFMEEAPKKFFRLAPGREVRLRNACVIRCDEVVKNGAGEVVALKCSCDPETFGANPSDGRKIKGTIHWVSATRGRKVPVRLYDRLFAEERPDRAEDFRTCLNPESLRQVEAWVEPALLETAPGETVQFERTGYFTADSVDSAPGAPVFNRTVTLRDSWAKMKR